jgi:hypothetical protein
MEKISWTDHVRNEEVLLRVNAQRNNLHEISKRSVAYTYFPPPNRTHSPKPPHGDPPQEVMAIATTGEYKQPQEDTPLLFMFIF